MIEEYLHITMGFKSEFISKHPDNRGLLDFYIDDFIKHGGEAFITNYIATKATPSDQDNDYLRTQVAYRGRFYGHILDNDGYTYVVWSVSQYINCIKKDAKIKLNNLKTVLCRFIENGGIVVMGWQLYTDVDEFYIIGITKKQNGLNELNNK